mgnify:CR=1 FL=1
MSIELVAILLVGAFGVHYIGVLWLVSEAIKKYHLDRYTMPAVLSLLMWLPIIYVVHRID